VEINGRQKITYTIPNGEFEDTISFRIQVSWMFLLFQFWVYPTFVLALIFLMIRRRRRKKKAKKQRKVVKASQASKVGIGDSEFLDLHGFHSGGLHGDLEQFQDYSNPVEVPVKETGHKKFD
jgi:predicted membrane protein